MERLHSDLCIKRNPAARISRLLFQTKPRVLEPCLCSVRIGYLWGRRAIWGPIDPQFRLANGSFASAKAIIAAVEDAEQRIQANPETYPLHASLLNDISGLLVQQAKDAIGRTDDQLKEALAYVEERDEIKVRSLAKKLRKPLIQNTQSHGAAISSRRAKQLGLPVKEVSSSEDQWQKIWRMWAKYASLNAEFIYEGQTASQVKVREMR